MGRISKRGAALQKNAEQHVEENRGRRRYKAGIYARLSSDQDKKACRQALKNESVETQIEIAKKFVEEYNEKAANEVMDIVECYTDLGKTGSNFEREGFLRLLQDIRLGDINCVIVKDLSRFGRNYLEAGNYIERIFPFLGVRFIAIADGFDTGKAENENKQMTSEIKNLVNDMYAKDFSQKARIHLKQRREQGSYVGGPPPYGYKAKWEGKRRILIPDTDTKEIVRFIYMKFVETESYTAVANELNRRRINPPKRYSQTREVYYGSGNNGYKGWDKGAGERILKSAVYTGALVQGKSSITARNEKNRIHKAEEEWTVMESTHEPLIGKDLYGRAIEVRQKIEKRTAAKKHPAEDCPLEENIFDNVLYCGVCGRKMTRSSQVKQYADGEKARLEGYFCLNSGQTKTIVCPESNRISKNELLEILLPLIRMEFAVCLKKPKRYIEYGKERIAEAEKRIEGKKRDAEGKMRRFREEEGMIYMSYHAGEILQKDYVAFKLKQEDRLEELLKQQQEWKKEKKKLDKRKKKYLPAIRALMKLKNGKHFTKDLVEAFINKIYIYPGKRIQVLFTVTADSMGG